jgi:putative flippase GtrA
MKLSVSAGRFALTGVAATLLHIAAAAALIEGFQWHPGTANGAAFILANGMSYVVNTRWSFRSRLNLDTWRRFIMVSLAAWGLTVAIAWGVEMAGGHYLLGIALVVSLVPALSFLGHRWFTYR